MRMLFGDQSLLSRFISVIKVALAVITILFPSQAVSYQLAISNERSDEVLLHDAEGRVLRQLLSCKRPRGMLVEPVNQDLWVACSDEDAIVRIDPESGEVKQRIAGFSGATNLALLGSEQLIVSNEGAASVSLVDTTTNVIVSQLPTGNEPDGIVYSADHKRIFVASENAGVVHVFSSEDFHQEALLLTNLRPRRMAINKDELWVSSEMGSRVEIFNAASLQKMDRIIFSPRGFRSEQLTPVDLIFSSDGLTAYVALGAANHVAIVDVVTREVEKYILVGSRAWGLELSPDGTRLYVLNGLSDDMTIIDLESRRPIASERTGLVPHAVEVVNR